MQSDEKDTYWREDDYSPPEEIAETDPYDPVAEADQEADITQGDLVRWEAYEHQPQQRSASWYVILGAVTLLLMAVAFFVIRSWSFVLVIAAASAALVVYAKRPPRSINYTLSPKGLYVDDQLRSLDQYKAFGVNRSSDDQFTLVLLPTKRFMPGLTADFPESVGEKIVDILAARLPMQEVEPDMVDQLIRKLRL